MSKDVKRIGFTVLADPKDVAVADIIFIHGLRGHPKRTWTKPPRTNRARKLLSVFVGGNKGQPSEENGTYWPRDLLPQDINNCRILAYGYNADTIGVFEAANQNSIFSHARNMLPELRAIRMASDSRPLIWVAHSLGGIIVKEVMRQAKGSELQPEFIPIYKCTCGIIFLGTPHRGSSIAPWGVIAGNIARAASLDVNKEIVRGLQSDSAFLEMIRAEFMKILREGSIRIHTFREERGLRTMRDKVVDDFSSVIDDAAEVVQGIDANHMDMCRFDSRSDTGYERIVAAIKSQVSSLSEKSMVTDAKAATGPQDDAAAQREKKEAEEKSNFFESIQEWSTEKQWVEVPEPHPGTADWIFKSSLYPKWEESDEASVLSFLGPPGWGKSVLAKFISGSLRGKYSKNGPSGSAYLVVSFACKDTDDKRNTFDGVVNGLLYQLLNQIPYIYESLKESKYGHALTQKTTNPETLHAMLKYLLERHKVICIIDGIDELRKADISRLLDFVQSHTKKLLRPLKFLLFSRPLQEIHDRRHNFSIYSMTIGDVCNPIGKFVKDSVAKLVTDKDYDAELAAFVEEKVVAESKGMFLWTSLVLNELADEYHSSSPAAVKCTLELFPADLDGVYMRTLQRLEPKVYSKAQMLYTVLMTATHPLTVEEVGEIYGFCDEGRQTLAFKDHIPKATERTVKAICGSLVTVEDNRVQLIHQSAKEFLTNEKTLTVVPAGFEIPSEPEAQCFMLEICIDYMNLIDREYFENESSSTQPSPLSIMLCKERFPFWTYAVKNWGIHAYNSGASVSRLRDKMVAYFQSKTFKRWAHVFSIGQRKAAGGDHYSAQLGSLPTLAVAYFDLGELFEDAFRTEADVYATSPGFISPLIICAAKDSKSVAKKLLRIATVNDINFQGHRSQTLLHFCAVNGHTEVLSWALDAGADPNIKDIAGFTALMYSATTGRIECVRKLLEAGADTGITDDLGISVICHASRQGNVSLLKCLLEYGADMHIAAKTNVTALAMACWHGHLHIIQHLIEAGFNLDWEATFFENALVTAISQGNIPIFDYLMRLGLFERLLKTERKGIPEVHATITYNQPTMLRKLHGAGADINGLQHGVAPLHDCCWAHDKGRCLDVLIELGADFTVASEDGQLPLEVASTQHNIPALKALINAGARLDTLEDGGMQIAIIDYLITKESKLLQQVLRNCAADVINSPLRDLDIRMTARIEDIKLMGFIHMAAVNSDIEFVNFLISKGADINFRAPLNGATALMGAAEQEQSLMLAHLLDIGADINQKDDNGHTALNYASERGNAASVRVLLSNGADFNNRNNTGATVAMGACLSSNPEVLQILIEAGADVNATDSTGCSALFVATEKGRVNMVKVLIGAKCDVNHAIANGWTALAQAVQKEQTDIVAALLEAGADPNMATEDGLLPLLRAAASGNLEVIRLLLKHGASGRCYNSKDGNSPLHSACVSPTGDEISSAIVEPLIKAGADPNAQLNYEDGLNYTPLHFAAIKDLPKTITALVKCGADPNMRDANGRTPFEVSAALKCYESMKALAKIHTSKHSPANDDFSWIRFYVEVIEKNQELRHEYLSPLQLLAGMAVHSKDIDTLYKIVDMGDMTVADSSNMGPFHITIVNGILDVTRKLLDSGSDPNIAIEDGGLTPLIIAVKAESNALQITTLLLERGANPNVQDDYGRTVLHHAVEVGDAEIVRTLLIHGANPNIRNKIGFTPLLDAVMSHSNFEAVAELLAEVSIASLDSPLDIDGDRTMYPVHFIVFEKRIESLKLMLKLGIDVDIQANNEEAFTALHCACQSGCVEAVKLLVDHGADVNKGSAYECSSPLAYTMACPDEEAAVSILNILLANGAKTDIDQWGFSAMHHAAFAGKLIIMRRLRFAGVDINVVGANKGRPFEAALWNNHIEAAHLLVRFGADPSARLTKYGFTGFLVQISAGVQESLNAWIDEFKVDCSLMDNVFGFTALHFALFKGPRNQDLARKIIDSTPADKLIGPPTLENGKRRVELFGMNPLDWASQLGYDSLAKRLEEVGFKRSKRSEIRSKLREYIIRTLEIPKDEAPEIPPLRAYLPSAFARYGKEGKVAALCLFSCDESIGLRSGKDCLDSLDDVKDIVHLASCDGAGCGKRIEGCFRYNCVECSQADFCESCFLKGSRCYNSEHEYLKIPDESLIPIKAGFVVIDGEEKSADDWLQSKLVELREEAEREIDGGEDLEADEEEGEDEQIERIKTDCKDGSSTRVEVDPRQATRESWGWGIMGAFPKFGFLRSG